LLGLWASVVQGADLSSQVVAAVRFAYGLEAAYWQDPSAFPTRDAVYRHYRQGFSPALAEAMTSHTLSSNGNLATWIPEQVHVSELTPTFALVWFLTPPAFGDEGLWGLEDYMHLRLRRDGDRWVVYQGEDRPAPPSH
jgi:hypothetical protein